MSCGEAFKIIELEQQINGLRMQLTFCHTAMRNAIIEIEEGETDEAIATLRGIIGENE